MPAPILVAPSIAPRSRASPGPCPNGGTAYSTVTTHRTFKFSYDVFLLTLQTWTFYLRHGSYVAARCLLMIRPGGSHMTPPVLL